MLVSSDAFVFFPTHLSSYPDSHFSDFTALNCVRHVLLPSVALGETQATMRGASESYFKGLSIGARIAS